jgi:uncharacterized cupredoxin-like copper-binding protein
MMQAKRLPGAAVYALLLVVPLFWAGCSLDLCRIFNCDTLFFIEDISQALQDLANNAGGGGGDGDQQVVCTDLGTTPTKASEWIEFVNWDEATRVEMSAHEVSEDSFHFMPDHLEFVAGKPYIWVMQTDEDNQEKHYFHAPDFYKAIATRKAQTANAEYKAPYFDDIELTVNGELELYFVPVIEGEYELWCTITGHRDKGMEGTLHIVCGEGLSLDLEVDPNFSTALASDERRSGSHTVWDSKQTQTVSMVENSLVEGSEDLAFNPANFSLTAETAYVLTLQNPASNGSKHYYTAAEFYQTVVTRKAEDTRAEIKAPYFKAIELLIGGSTDLYIVPTVAGSYNVVCTVTGHEAAGMTGTITVTE